MQQLRKFSTITRGVHDYNLHIVPPENGLIRDESSFYLRPVTPWYDDGKLRYVCWAAIRHEIFNHTDPAFRFGPF